MVVLQGAPRARARKGVRDCALIERNRVVIALEHDTRHVRPERPSYERRHRGASGIGCATRVGHLNDYGVQA